MFLEIGILAAGIAPGWLLRGNPRAEVVVGRATTLSIYALLCILGFRLGSDKTLLRALHVLGIQGLTLGFCCTMGSAACAVPFNRLFRSPREEEFKAKKSGNLWQGMRGSFKIVILFCGGILLGVADFLPDWLHGDTLFMYVLWIMLIFVGMGMGFNLRAFLLVRDMGARVLLLPFLTIAGTAVGAALASCFFASLDLRSSLAAGAGMGYYSLATVLATEFATPALASITLTANVFRELFILLATPLLARGMGPLAPVMGAASPGVDVCLPAIMHFCGERYALLAVFNGLVMTILVPFMMPLILTFGK